MRLLDRYLLRELLNSLSYCLTGFFIFWVAFDLIQRLDGLLELKLTVGDLVKYYLLVAPKFMIIVMPIGFLLALLMTLTGLARHNEIVAMRAAGVSIWRLGLPFFIVGFGLSLIVLATNELWVPDNLERAEEIRLSHKQKSPDQVQSYIKRNLGFTNARERRVWHIGQLNLNTGEMYSPQVTSTLADGTRWQMFAERAVITNGNWLFYNVRLYRESQKTNAPPVPILQTNLYYAREFTETLAGIKSEIKMSTRLQDRAIKEVDVPVSEILEYLRLHPNPEPKDRSWLYTELHGRLAGPWTSFFVVLIALPFGITSGRKNAFVGVASAIFICFGFHILQQFGFALGASGWLPAWVGGWFPNLAFGTIGLILTARMR